MSIGDEVIGPRGSRGKLFAAALARLLDGHPAMILGRARPAREGWPAPSIPAHLHDDLGLLGSGCATDPGLLECAARLRQWQS